MSEKYTPEEIKKAKEQEMEDEGKHLTKENEMEKRYKKYLHDNERTLRMLEKLPDDTPVYIGYQYKYRPQNTEEVMSAKEAVATLTHWLEYDFVDINGLEVKVLSEEEARAFKVRMERELLAKQAEYEHEQAERARWQKFAALRIIPNADINLVIDPELKRMKNLGIAAAIRFIDTLKESVEKPKDYIGKQKEASAMDKFLHEGWSEHNDLKHAFQSAVKIESRISPAMISRGKKNFNVEVFFIDKNSKKTMTISTVFDEDGEQSGGISMSKP